MPKMTSLQVREQIERLEKRARELEATEVKEVIARIQAAIKHYQLTAEDLFAVGAPAKTKRARGRKVAESTPAKAEKRASPRKTTKGLKVAPKFKDANGNTWSGRGTMPKWLAAEIAAGKTVQEFAI